VSRLLRLYGLSVLALAALAASLGGPAGATLTCPGQTTTKPFVPWLDTANYALVQNGALESTSGWTLTGGAKLVTGNEPWKVNVATDSRSLLLPSGSSATSPALCVTLLHPTLRFFAMNSGAATTTLKVEVLTKVLGLTTVTPVGFVTAGSWQPTLPLLFLTNLVAPVSGSIQFRFTPVGSNSGWRVDDVYVDPYKQR
jgi:hypothetical protein